MIGGLFDEFWPDIQSRLFKRHKTEGQSATP
jgi:hypothetical protein